ncbi:TetR family transcriptional regulator C-terminal domain-containing protein [Rubellimicrobium roseum]|nr:TetR family transcriptional regulator C-terminal domain-containing protein [Rubellimicrobium roseum]
MPREHVEETYLGLYAMIDGFWIRQFIDPNSFRMHDARRICRAYLRRAIEA